MTPEFIPSSVGATHSLRFGIWSAWLFLLSRCRWLSSDHYRATCRWQSQHQQDGSTLPDGLIWLLAYLWLPIFFSHTQKQVPLRTWPKMKLLPTSEICNGTTIIFPYQSKLSNYSVCQFCFCLQYVRFLVEVPRLRWKKVYLYLPTTTKGASTFER